MSKGINISHIEDGEYSVEIELDTDAIDAEITRLDAKIADIDSQLSGLEEGLAKSILELKKTALEKRKEYLEDPANVPVNPTEDIWCADLTKDLSGDVGIIDVTGLRGGGSNIQPGYNENAFYGEDRDGMLKPVIAVPSPEAFWNWAMQGGWQKWKPTYRYGTITVIDKDLDTCTITLDDTLNPDTDLDVNNMATLSDVPIEYMDCDSSAFDVKDVVIVKFEDNDWSKPKVIGFKDHPKGCYWEGWGDTLTSNHDWVQTGGDSSVTDGVMELKGVEVNAGLDWLGDGDDEFPAIGTLVIKVSASTPQYVAMVVLTDTGALGFTFAGDFPFGHDVGDNDGEPMEIDMTAYEYQDGGFPVSGEPIKYIFLTADANRGDTEPAIMTIDYITFRSIDP